MADISTICPARLDALDALLTLQLGLGFKVRFGLG